MTRTIFLFIAAVAGSLVLPATAISQTPQYSVTAPSGSSNPYPFFNNLSANKSQSIYHPEDFANAKPGMMTAIYVQAAFPVTAGTPTYYNFTVKMKQYQPDTLNSPPNPPAKPWITGLTTVFSAANWTLSGPVKIGDWIKIPLQTPFPFSKEINLLVEMSQGPDTPTNSFGVKCYVPSHAYSRLIGEVGAAMSKPGSTSTTPIIGFDLMSTSVGSLGGNADITVYPNPAVNELFVSGAPANSSYTIADITGRALQQGAISTQQINVSQLASGMYLLNIFSSSDGTVGKIKFIRQ